MEKIWKKTKKTLKIYKILPFLDKINPYKQKTVNDEGKVIDSKILLLYRQSITWIIDICLNGLVLNFIFYCWRIQPLHWGLVLGNGLLIWFTSLAIKQLWAGYVDGKKEINK